MVLLQSRFLERKGSEGWIAEMNIDSVHPDGLCGSSISQLGLGYAL
jgi:hypothetical protein